MKRMVTTMAAWVAISLPLAGATAPTLSPTPLFDGKTKVPSKSGATQAVRVSVQSWTIFGPEDKLPLRGFYVAHLVSGQISTTIDGQKMEHLPGDYWAVKAGQSMQVKVVGEVAVLETIVVAKE
jgi:hypothetical protein